MRVQIWQTPFSLRVSSSHPSCASMSTQVVSMPQTSPSSQPKRRKSTSQTKRVSFAPGQSTSCPPPRQGSTKQVRFTSDTKPGSRKSDSAGSMKTRWQSPPSKTKPPASTKGGALGLSSVKRDFETKKPAQKPAPKLSKPSTRPKTKPPDAQIWILADGTSRSTPPTARHQQSGYEWVAKTVIVKPTGKDWRKEGWAT